MHKLLYPQSIAIIGVSEHPNKIGHTIAKNILAAGFHGRVFFVHPTAKKILGKKCYPTIQAIEETVEVAIVVVPSGTVVSVVTDCGKKGVNYAVIISSGFSETGDAGKALEEKLRYAAKAYGLRILGPNCLGVLNAYAQLNASFAAGMIAPGNVGFFSQSGAICSALLDWSKNNGLGFSQFVSLGNKIDINEVEMIEFFMRDEKTKVVLGYLESFSHGTAFYKRAQELTETKPMILLKSGRSQAGEAAAASHTGALVSDDKVVDAVCHAANIIRANTLEEFFDLAKLFSWQPMMKGNGVAVISNAGGPAVITTDLIAHSNLSLAELSLATKKTLKAKLPTTANTHNPIDIIGDADAKRYEDALLAVANDNQVHAMIIILTPQTVTEVEKTAKIITAVAKKSNKTTVACFIGGAEVKTGLSILEKNNVPAFAYPNQAVTALSAMAHYIQRRSLHESGTKYQKIIVDPRQFQDLQLQIEQAKSEGRSHLPTSIAERLLQSYNIDFARTALAQSAEMVEMILKQMHFPVVAKIEAQSITHKTEAGGVRLHIKDTHEALLAFNEITQAAKKHKSSGEIEGVLFQEQVKSGLEIIIGARRDAQFGPILIFGMGGIFVEVVREAVMRLIPVSRHEAKYMLESSRLYPILAGARTHKPYEIEKIVSLLNAVSQIMVDFPQIEEIDLNPCIATPERTVVVDARFIIQ